RLIAHALCRGYLRCGARSGDGPAVSSPNGKASAGDPVVLGSASASAPIASWKLTLFLIPLVLLAFWNGTIMLGLLGLSAAAILMPFASWLALVFFGAALALRDPFNAIPVLFGPFRFYAGD